MRRDEIQCPLTGTQMVFLSSAFESCSWQRLAWTLSAKGLKGLGRFLDNPMPMSHPTPPALAQLTAGLLFPALYSSSKLRLGCPFKPTPSIAPAHDHHSETLTLAGPGFSGPHNISLSFPSDLNTPPSWAWMTIFGSKIVPINSSLFLSHTSPLE